VTITSSSPPEQRNRAAKRCYIAARAPKCSLLLVARMSAAFLHQKWRKSENDLLLVLLLLLFTS